MLRAILAAAFSLLIAVPVSSQTTQDVRIATFNVQNFVAKKASTPMVMKALAEIVRKFDIVAVQELSDVNNRVPGIFLQAINATGRKFDMLVSDRTGRQPDDRTSQEQYAYYFDSERIDALDRGALFNDGAQDLFQREPFTASFGLKR